MDHKPVDVWVDDGVVVGMHMYEFQGELIINVGIPNSSSWPMSSIILDRPRVKEVIKALTQFVDNDENLDYENSPTLP